MIVHGATGGELTSQKVNKLTSASFGGDVGPQRRVVTVRNGGLAPLVSDCSYLSTTSLSYYVDFSWVGAADWRPVLLVLGHLFLST